jgi:hypothetical protein
MMKLCLPSLLRFLAERGLIAHAAPRLAVALIRYLRLRRIPWRGVGEARLSWPTAAGSIRR